MPSSVAAGSASWRVVDDFTRECPTLVDDTSLSGLRAALEFSKAFSPDPWLL
jgi:hypothetical protein